MAETPVPPALTPEEWQSFPNWPERHARDQSDAPLYFPTKHGIAAANLYGQPFGFTPEDIELITRCANGCDGTLGADDDERVFADGIRIYMRDVRRLESLASRIAALLPPTADDGTP